MDSVCTVSGLVAVGTRLGECLALSMLWERHSYASRCIEETKREYMWYTLSVDTVYVAYAVVECKEVHLLKYCT